MEVREVSAQYTHGLDRFRDTELGLLPADWSVSTVGAEFSIQLGKMLDAKKNEGIQKPFIGNRSVQWGRIELNDIGTVPMTDKDLKKYRLRRGDLLVCEGGEVGRAAIWRDELPECYYQKALHRLRPRKAYSPELLVSVLKYLADEGALSNFVTQTSIAHLPKDKFETVPIPLPATKREQDEIAKALRDTDALIESLEQLIAKKRLIKQGAMQELLTGKRRVSGLSGVGRRNSESIFSDLPADWEEKPLSSVLAPLRAGTSVNSVERPIGGRSHKAILKTSCVAQGDFKPDQKKWIHPKDLHRVQLSVRRGAILISRMNTPDLVGECGYVDQEYPDLFLPDRLWEAAAQTSVRCNTFWLSKVLSSVEARNFMKLVATGTSGSMKNISKAALLSMVVPWPDPDEQDSMANLFRDMDHEIESVSKRLGKLRLLKQAMTRELLTGRIRLV